MAKASRTLDRWAAARISGAAGYQETCGHSEWVEDTAATNKTELHFKLTGLVQNLCHRRLRYWPVPISKPASHVPAVSQVSDFGGAACSQLNCEPLADFNRLDMPRIISWSCLCTDSMRPMPKTLVPFPPRPQPGMFTYTCIHTMLYARTPAQQNVCSHVRAYSKTHT